MSEGVRETLPIEEERSPVVEEPGVEAPAVSAAVLVGPPVGPVEQPVEPPVGPVEQPVEPAAEPVASVAPSGDGNQCQSEELATLGEVRKWEADYRASQIEVKQRQDLAAVTGDAQKLTFATAVLGGSSVDEAARAAGIRAETGRLWLKKDSEVREVIVYAMEQAGIDPVEIVRFHKRVRDRAYDTDQLTVARTANVDLARMAGLQVDGRPRKRSDEGSGVTDRMMKLLQLIESREVDAEVV